MIYDYGQMLKRIENEIGKGVYEKNKGNFYYQDELIYYIKNSQLFQNLKRVKFCARCSCLSNFGGRRTQLLQLQLLLKFDSC